MIKFDPLSRISALVLLVAAVAQFSAVAAAREDPKRVYAVLGKQPDGFYSVLGKKRIGNTGYLAGYMQKRGVLWFNIDSLTMQLYNDGDGGLPELDFGFLSHLGSGLRMMVRSTGARQYVIDSVYALRAHGIDATLGDNAGSNDAPYGPSNSEYMYSPSLLDSVKLPKGFRKLTMHVPIDSVAFMIDSAKNVHYMSAWDFPVIHRTPYREDSRPQMFLFKPALSGRKWYTRLDGASQVLYAFRGGDSTLVRIDSMPVDGAQRRLRPEALLRMWADSVLYQDSAGFFAVLAGDTMTTPSLPFVPHRFRAENKWLYLFRFDADSVRIAFTDRKRWPQWIRWSVHPDFQSIHLESWRQSSSKSCMYGDLGVSLGYTTFPATLITSPTHPYPFDLGCLVGQDSTFPAYQGMLATWRDGQGRPMVVSDQGCVTRVVRPGFGYITHPSLFHDELKGRVTDIYQSTFLYGALPWYGIRRPQAWLADDGDTLVHAGAVVRRLRRGGDMLDTLAPVAAQAWCRLDANRWAFADHRSVTIVGPTGASTTAVPYDSVRFRPGYASSLVPLQDGALLISYYGAVRADTDLVRQPYRRGGMVRLLSDGTTAAVTLPSEAGSYVYPVHRLDGGLLVALSATFSDDTIIGENINRQGLDNVRVLTSTDDGTTWSASEALFFNGPWVPTTGRFVRTGAQTILGVMPGSMIVSTDNGTTWNFDERFTSNLSVCDFDITGDTMLLATSNGLYQYVQQTTSVADTPTPPASESRTMSREAFITMMEQLGDNSTIVDIRGRRIYNVQSVHSGMMLFVQTVTGVAKIIVE